MLDYILQCSNYEKTIEIFVSEQTSKMEYGVINRGYEDEQNYWICEQENIKQKNGCFIICELAQPLWRKMSGFDSYF